MDSSGNVEIETRGKSNIDYAELLVTLREIRKDTLDGSL
jgi:hypothetical protein